MQIARREAKPSDDWSLVADAGLAAWRRLVAADNLELVTTHVTLHHRA
ncbi:MAG TPA: hypothetical protein VG826_18305 [Pirellulales bacterium]|nr:hypothetical protein [Pirellulales bacterium]